MKKPQINIFCSILTISLCGATLTKPKEYRKLQRTGNEFVPKENRLLADEDPTCEELRAMWRFSKRQSRASEVTNEIPTYRDPFAYNVWEMHPRPRSAFGLPRYPMPPPSKNIYGKIIRGPDNHHRALTEHGKTFKDILRYADNRRVGDGIRRTSGASFRLSGGQAQPNKLPNIKGSFERLRELIYAERARDLQQQRLQESQSWNSEDRSSYISPDEKKERLKLLGEIPDAAYAPETYLRPYRRRSIYNSDPTDEELW